MSVEEQITQSRRTRRHRNRRALVMGSGVAVAYVLALLFLPDESPLHGLVTLAFAACLNGVTLYEHRDAFQWQLARDTFVIGAAVGLGWMSINVVVQALDSHYVPDLGESLGITGGAWSVAWIVQQVRIDRSRHPSADAAREAGQP